MRTLLCRTFGESWRLVTFRCIGLAAVCLLAATPLPAADYTYVRISVPGSVETWANGINARGDIVGLYFTPDGEPHGYLLRKGVYTTLEHPDAAALAARRINSGGDIAGVWHDFDGGLHGFLLSGGQLTHIQKPDSSFTWTFGLNDAGDIVGVSDSGGFLLRNGKFRTVPSGGVRGVDYRLFDIQDNGRVMVGTAIGPTAVTGFISRRFGEVELISYPDLPGNCTAFRGMNERGDIVGSVDTDTCFPPFGNARGFLLRNGEFTPIHFPGAQGTDAWDINDDGVIVGRYIDSAGHLVGFKAKPRN
jgi:uncharacterized membrane protein